MSFIPIPTGFGVTQALAVRPLKHRGTVQAWVTGPAAVGLTGFDGDKVARTPAAENNGRYCRRHRVLTQERGLPPRP